MRFLGFGGPAPPAPAPAPAPARVVPAEEALLQALRAAYRCPAVATTQAMHEHVAARHPHWTVNLKRVRRLLCRVAAQPEAECREDEDWCVVSTPRAAPAPVAELWAARRRARDASEDA